MNEIEKLYENAGIPKYGKRQCKDSEYLECQNYCFINMDNKCDKFGFTYPPFTAEKQIEITKFIGLHYGFQMLKNEAFDYIIATKIYVKYEYEYKGYGYGYDEAIANLVNNLWQDLTEEERKQIKEILE